MSDDIALLTLHRVFQFQAMKLACQLHEIPDPAELLEKYQTDITDEIRHGVDADVNWLSSSNQHHLIRFTDADYPSYLAEIFDPPVLLFAVGQREQLALIDPGVAIVGARKASHYGLRQSRVIAEDLAQRGVSVISGLALGIDAAAHEGALAALGQTIAVLGTGIDVVYPRRNWRLAERICADGLLLSEYATGVDAYPMHFPQRNRIVTGLARATVVIEAALASGSLISARLAMNEGREVFAMPGEISRRSSKGCHQLIKDGAQLLEGAQDVLEYLGLGEGVATPTIANHQSLSAEQQLLLQCLESGPCSIDTLAAQVNMAIEELTISLVSLEVLGLVVMDAGRYERLDHRVPVG